MRHNQHTQNIFPKQCLGYHALLHFRGVGPPVLHQRRQHRLGGLHRQMRVHRAWLRCGGWHSRRLQGDLGLPRGIRQCTDVMGRRRCPGPFHRGRKLQWQERDM